MNRTIGALLCALAVPAFAEEVSEVPDAGAPVAEVAPAVPAPPPAPAPVAPKVETPPPPPTFDFVQSPWGPGRKSSGEKFSSMALAPAEGPLRWRWQDFSVALGGQYFARGELRDNADFASANGDHALGFDQRARFTMRAAAKNRVGVLLELQDVRAWGSEPNTVTVTPNTGLHQGFVDLKATDWLDVRVGRQELSYGEDRLIGNLDWAQSARAFDGVFLRLTASKAVTLDAFGMMLKAPAWVTPDSGAPRFHQSGSYFTGLYSRARFGTAGLDVYALGLLEDPSTAALGHRRDSNRLTLGARGFGAFGGLALLGEAAFQTGKTGQANDLVLAGAFAGKATYTFKAWGSPYLGAEFSGATGDGVAGDGVDNGFHQLFPTGHAHLGFMDYVGWQNVVAGRGTIGFKPWGAHVWLDVHHFRSWDPRGAWFAANGSVFQAADATRTASELGTEFDLSATVPIAPQVALAGAFSVFLPGAASARGTSPSTWGFLYVRTQL